MGTCVNGHASDAEDYCDVCGVRLGATVTGAVPAPTIVVGPAGDGTAGNGAGPAATPAPAAAVASAVAPAPSTNGKSAVTATLSTLTGPTVTAVPTPIPAPPGAAPARGADPAPTGGAGGEMTCQHCGVTQDHGHKYCEVCGADMATGTPPPPPPPKPAPPPPIQSRRSSTASSTGGRRWEAVVEADRDYFERLGVDGIDFPMAAPARTFSLLDANVLVGRRSVRRGIDPHIDLTGSPEDPGVSHAHCTFVRQPDGSFVLVDNGSTNGTRLNDDLDPVPANRPIPLADGDRVHVGAWTTIRIRRR